MDIEEALSAFKEYYLDYKLLHCNVPLGTETALGSFQSPT